MHSPMIANLLFVTLAALLVVAAVGDWRTYRIANRLNLAIALLAIPLWLALALPVWPDIGWRLITAGIVFGLLALAFRVGMMGGGDVKLAAALALWMEPLDTARFLVFMSLAGGVLTILVIYLHRKAGREGRPKVPYGVAIAAGALWLLAQRFLNHFA